MHLSLQPVQRKLLLALTESAEFSRPRISPSRLAPQYCLESGKGSEFGSLDLNERNVAFILDFCGYVSLDLLLLRSVRDFHYMTEAQEGCFGVSLRSEWNQLSPSELECAQQTTAKHIQASSR